MDLTYRLLTPATEWPADPSSLAAAIRSQGPFHPEVEIGCDIARIRDLGTGLTSTGRLLPYSPAAYDTLIQEGWRPRMTGRDRDTALPFQREVILTTPSPADAHGGDPALFHATVADGLWWLLGGFLVDPYRRAVWGWRQWRGDQGPAAHAAETAALIAAGTNGE